MRKMRRQDKAIEIGKAMELLAECEYGVLSTIGTDGQPYGVPLNYAYKDGCIYFHCARQGHKIENIENNPKVSFCAVGDTNLLPSDFSTAYESVVVFGIASEVRGTERHMALIWLVEKYSPGFMDEGKAYIEQQDKVTKVVKIEINHISGKQSPAR